MLVRKILAADTEVIPCHFKVYNRKDLKFTVAARYWCDILYLNAVGDGVPVLNECMIPSSTGGPYGLSGIEATSALFRSFSGNVIVREVKQMHRRALKTTIASSALLLAAAGSAYGANKDRISFDMVVSQGASTCLPDATAKVTVISTGTAEDMFIYATGLPPNTDFDFFVIQVPTAPFGLSWYQGDVETDKKGDAFQHFRGRFSIETFIIAPGVAAAPQIFNDPPFPDANQNPETFGPDGKTPGPVQTYHLGLWFNDPADAQKAGCANTVTPFNGEHNAGIQVLNTANFPPTQGPLLSLQP